MPESVPCGLCGSPDADVQDPLTRLADLSGPYRVQRCRRCGFVYESPRPSPDELVSTYQGDAFWDEERIAHRPPRGRFDGARFERLERWTGGPGSLLALGCLDGGFVMACGRSRGWETLTVEFVDGAMKHAALLGLPMVHSPFWDLGVTDRRFDAIFTQSLEHVPDVRATLGQFRDHLRPGGFIVVEAPNQFEALKEVAKGFLLGIVGDRLLDHVYREVDQSVHLSFFTPRTLRRAVEDAGFDVLEMRSYLPWNPNYHATQRLRVSKELAYLVGGMVGRGPSTELIARAG